MLYSIDLIAAGNLVIDHMLPAIMLFFALALAIVFIDRKETSMNQKPKGLPHKSGQTLPSYPAEVIKQKQKAEQREIAGRHKNSGAKDHKGAR